MTITNEGMRRLIAFRVNIEQRIIDRGGKIPAPWPWADQDFVIRNLQLLEYAEALERGDKKLPLDMTEANRLLKRP